MKVIRALIGATCLLGSATVLAQSPAKPAPGKLTRPATSAPEGGRMAAGSQTGTGSGNGAGSGTPSPNCPMDRQGKPACTVEVDGTGNGGNGSGTNGSWDPGTNPGGAVERPTPGPGPGGEGAGTSSATEAGFRQDAQKIAEGLELPCPGAGELPEIYIARMMKYCQSTVKGAFPVLTWIFPSVPPTACRLAGIEEKAGQVLLGVATCKAQ